MAREKNALKNLIRIPNGDSYIKSYDLLLKDDSGNTEAINLTGKTLGSFIGQTYSGSAEDTFDITVTDAVNGQISVELTKAATTALSVGDHVYQIYYSNDSDPDHRQTIMKGTLVIDDGVDS